MDFTTIVPFWNGNTTLQRLLDSLSGEVIIVRDAQSEPPSFKPNNNVRVIELSERGYFAGAVNAGVAACQGDVLIVNQDTWLEGSEWLDPIIENRAHYGLIGDGVFGHRAWPSGYVQGTLMYITRAAWDKVGKFNQVDYPLWGCTCEWQLRHCRIGGRAMPLSGIQGLHHEERDKFGTAITQAIRAEWDKRWLFVRTPPAISVIIPCFNYGHYLKDAINSLMAQTFQSFEVIIVDDASTDGSDRVCKSFADPFKAIRFIKRGKNGGTAATINTGIRKANGWFVTILSADDMYMPERLDKLWRAGLRNPHSVIFDDIIWRTNKNDTIKKMFPYHFDDVEWSQTEPPGLLSRNNMHAGIMFPLHAWREVGGYPEIMTDGREDWAFNIALGRGGYCGYHIEEPLYIHRRQGQNRSLHNTTPEHHKEFLSKLKRLFPDVYNGRYPMGCCGGRRAKGKAANAKKAPSPSPIRHNDNNNKDEALLLYIGRNWGREIIIGKSGRTYKYGLKPRYRRIFVDKDDVPGLMKSGLFRLINSPPPHPDPVIPTEPQEPIIDVDAEDIGAINMIAANEPDDALPSLPLSGDIDATPGALKLAAELSLDISELGMTGRIVKKDVEDYAKQIGIS